MLFLNTIKQSYYAGINKNTCNRANVSNCTYPKLKQLDKDTVSFTASAELNRTLMEAFNNKDVCKSVHENSKEAAADFQNTLNSYLGDLISTEENPKLPIHHIEYRIKSPESIREKAAEKLGTSILNNVQNTFNPNNPKDLKKNIGDLIGARIVLDNFDKKDTVKIIDKLAQACTNGDLKITKIQCYQPENSDKNLKYFNDKDILKLKKAANTNKPSNDLTKLVKQDKKTGYIGVHLDVDLSNPDKYVSNKDNYHGEIQILGYDVSMLKNVEDLCYKLESNKDLKRDNIAYKPFSKYFLHYLNLKPETKNNFEEYTRKAYIIQRQKEPKRIKGKQEKVTLPTIKECEMTGKIPEELDFNTLYKMKNVCDELYKFTSNL